MNESELMAQLYSERFPKREMPAYFVVRAEIVGDLSEAGGFTPSGDYKRPVYRNAVYVVIGDPESRERVERPMDERDKQGYPSAWKRFEASRDLSPIGHLPKITPAEVETAASCGMYYVEQLADADPEAVRDELRRWVPIACAYLGRKVRVRLAAEAA
jgi:hypothetical protein